MSDLWRAWPHRWFGWPCWPATQDDLFPARERLLDPSWKPEDLPQMLEYLRRTPIGWCSQSNYAPCPECGEPLQENATALWDGEWLWPHSLAHHVEKHSMRLPDAMVARIRQRRYQPPDVSECDVEQAWAVTEQLAALLIERRPRIQAGDIADEAGAEAVGPHG
jgi:hypothetical protein